MEYVSRSLVAVRYTGQNGAEVLTMCQLISQLSGNNWSTLTDDGATLLLRETGTTGLTADWPVLAGQWVVVDMSVGIIARLSDATYQARYRALDAIIQSAVTANLDAIASSAPVQTAIKDRVAQALYGAIGVLNVPTLLGNASADLAVPILPAMPNTGYVASAVLSGAVAVLAGLSVTNVVKTSGSVVTVTVKNTGLISLTGAICIVHVTPPMTLPGKA